MKNILKRGLSFALALVMMVGLLPVTAFAAVDNATGMPKDVNNTLVLAIYTGEGFPGEPAVYGTEQYKNINSSFAVKSGSTFASTANNQLNWSKIQKDIVQGTASSNTYVWGVYDANGTKDFALENHEEFVAQALEEMPDRFKDGENYAWVCFPGGEHAYNAWALSLYNCLLAFFRP